MPRSEKLIRWIKKKKELVKMEELVKHFIEEDQWRFEAITSDWKSSMKLPKYLRNIGFTSEFVLDWQNCL